MSMVFGGIMAGGALLSGYLGSQASGAAAQAQTNALNQSNQTQQAEFQANAGFNTPGRNLGYGADALLAELYGLPNPNAASTTSMYNANNGLNAFGGGAGGMGGSGAGGAGGGVQVGAGGASTTGSQTGSGGAPGNPSDQFANFFSSPGYQFTLSQGMQAINRGAAASGNLYSTNTLGALDKFAQGTASQQYNNYVNQLMNLAGIGSSANAATSAAATTAGNNISQNQNAIGSANASGILGKAGAWSGAINSATGSLGNASMLGGFGGGSYNPGLTSQLSNANFNPMIGTDVMSDRRTKFDVTRLYIDGTTQLPVYEFTYVTEPGTRYRGFMADEVREQFPEAVHEHADGFMRVDYNAVHSAVEARAHG